MPLLEVTGAVVGIFTNLYEHAIKPAIDRQRFASDRRAELESALRGYITSFYTKLSTVRTVVYNEPVELYKIYYPLTLINDKSDKEFEMNSNCHFIFSEAGRILIVDYAGMGKSTLSKHIFLRVCENKEYIPLFFELRRVKRDKGILDTIRDDLGGLANPASATVIQDIFSLQNVLLILDGFDEIPIELKDSSSREIIDIISRFPNIKYLITSRKDSFVDLAPGFESFYINELDRGDVENILKKYDPNDIQSDKIIKEIDKIEDESFHQLLSNPMMVTLLFRSYSYNQEIPNKTYLFYDQVYKSLFNGHDLLKGYIRKHESKLDIQQLQNILCYVSINSIKNGPSYETRELLKLLEEGIRRFGYNSTRPSDILADLCQAVPLISEEGSETRWIHKSFQDYFSAFYVSFIAPEQSKNILEGIMQSPKSYQYSNMIEMCFDMKPALVEEHIFLPLAQNYLSYASECRIKGIAKILYDNMYMRGLAHISNYRETEGVSQLGRHEIWESLSQDIKGLIPSNGIRARVQYYGESYTGTAEAANYWLFEMLIRRINMDYLVEIEEKYNHLVYKGLMNGEIRTLLGHSNVADISLDQRNLVLAAFARTLHKNESKATNLAINVDESALNEYIEQIISRLRLADVPTQF